MTKLTVCPFARRVGMAPHGIKGGPPLVKRRSSKFGTPSHVLIDL